MRFPRVLIRRCTCLVLMLTLGLLSSVEMQIADVHDGHQADLGAGQLAPVDGDGGSSAPASGHTVHVDHCAHAHMGLLATTDAPADPPHEHVVVPGLSALAPAGPAFAPPVPPPVA